MGLDAVFQRPSDDAQLQAAYELQLWKENKELEFEQHVCQSLIDGNFSICSSLFIRLVTRS